jgi:hypothetical protein
MDIKKKKTYNPSSKKKKKKFKVINTSWMTQEKGLLS